MSDHDLEMETIVRWDRASHVATFYTADVAEMRRWKKLGYSVEVCSTHQGRPSGWQAAAPIAAVALLPMKAGQVRGSRYLEPPTMWEPAGKAREPRGREKADENIEEIHTGFPGAAETRPEDR
jgi:hypothetical protein